MKRVTVRWDRERPAALVIKGDEVSEVRWLDDNSTQYIRNNHIQFDANEGD